MVIFVAKDGTNLEWFLSHLKVIDSGHKPRRYLLTREVHNNEKQAGWEACTVDVQGI